MKPLRGGKTFNHKVMKLKLAAAQPGITKRSLHPQHMTHVKYDRAGRRCTSQKSLSSTGD